MSNSLIRDGVARLEELTGHTLTVTIRGGGTITIDVPESRRVSPYWVHGVNVHPSPGTTPKNTFVGRWAIVGKPLSVNGASKGTVSALSVH